MQQRYLHQFVAVAEEHCFSLAARRLGITQPALSRQIQKLEEELGVQLFHRTTRRVELTDAGQVFLEEVQRGLTQMEWAVQAARRTGCGEAGRLAIGFVGPATYSVLPPLLRACQERFPRVELDLEELSTGRQLAALSEGQLQLGLLCPPEERNGLAIEQLLSEAAVVALPRRHALAGAQRVHLSDLGGETLLMARQELEPALFAGALRYCGGAGLAPKVMQGANSLHLVLSLVAAGLGVAFLPASIRNHQRPDVVYRALQPAAPRMVLAAAWRADDPSPALPSLLGVLREVTASATRARPADLPLQH